MSNFVKIRITQKVRVKSKIKISLWDCMIFVILFMSFHTTAYQVLGINTPVSIILHLIPIVFLMAFNKSIDLKFDFINFMWIFFALIIVWFNQDMRHGYNMRMVANLFTVFIVIAFQGSNDWIKSLRHALTFYVFEHMILGYFFIINSPFYNKYILPRFSFVDRSEIIRRGNNNGVFMGLCNHYSTSGLYCGIALIVAFCYFMIRPKQRNVIFVLLTLAALVLSQKRGPLLFAIFSLVIIYFGYNGIKRATLFRSLLLSAVGVTAFIIAYNNSDTFAQLFARFTIDNGGDITGGRISLYRLAIQIFLKHPIIGIGWGGYKYEFTEYIWNSSYAYKTLNAHNIYLQLLAETGIIGTLIVLMIMIITLTASIKYLHLSKKGVYTNEEKWVLMFSVGMQVYFLTNGLTENTLYYEQVLFPYAFSCAVTYYYMKKGKKNEYICS